jgi:hypothetical protein
MEQEVGDNSAAGLAIGLRTPRPDQFLADAGDLWEAHLYHQSEVARDLGRHIHDQLTGGAG